MATAISLAFSLFLTPVFLKVFRRIGWGQVIRTPEDIANPSHEAKRGTPTMGGVIFIVGTIVGCLGLYAAGLVLIADRVSALLRTPQAETVLDIVSASVLTVLGILILTL